jgi:hypothetical protein
MSVLGDFRGLTARHCSRSQTECFEKPLEMGVHSVTNNLEAK